MLPAFFGAAAAQVGQRLKRKIAKSDIVIRKRIIDHPIR
jgi:hypothetical protein